MKHLFPLLLFAALTSCSERPASPTGSSTAPDPYSGYAFITLGVDANPTNDFERAIATNDIRFVAYKFRVAGSPYPGLATPAVQGDDKDRYGVKVIAGTADDGPREFPLDAANKYATAYNQLLLQHLKAGKSN